MLILPLSVKLFLAPGATDLRLGFDGLAGRVREVLQRDPLLRGGLRYVAGRGGWPRGTSNRAHASGT